VSDQQSSGVILLVEDEPLVRLVAADLLADSHFQVIEAADAEEALTVLKAGVAVDVLVSDVEMPPGIDGFELAWEVHRRWPSVAILIASGRQWPAAGDLPPGAGFLAKPYSNATLVTRALAAATTAQAARAAKGPDGDANGDMPKTA
jgi:CheY-like chemotaxis protein